MAIVTVRMNVSARTNVQPIKDRFYAAHPHAMDAISGDLKSNIQSFLLPGHGERTGELRESIRETGRTDNTVYIGTSLWRAHFTEFGTRSHDVRPRSKKALWWSVARHPERAVVIGGSPEVGFMRKGLDLTRLTAKNTLVRAFKEQLER